MFQLRANETTAKVLSTLAFAIAASCKGCDERPAPTPMDAAKSVSEAASPGPSATLESEAAAPHPADASTTLAAEPTTFDAGASACRLLYGPAEQPFRGPAALTIVGQELRLIANESGKPRVFTAPITAPSKGPPVVPPKPTSFTGMRWPPCELAGSFVYCQAPGNTIIRSRLEGGEGKVIAKNRSSTRIAAAALGAEHSVVAFLDLKKTSEGDMLQAFVALDDKDPVRVSEDGAGATTLRFLPRREGASLVYLDTRTAMVPVHARPLSLKNNNELALGTDVVVFVGGAPERGIDFSVASAGGKGFAFIPMPMPQSTIDFGMAALPIEDPAKETEAVWSRYPNGIDPAPVGSAPSKDGKHAIVARVRPRSKEVGSPKVLELGRIDPGGTFTSWGEIASGKNVTDIAVIDDGAGIWILYGDTTVTWLERRGC